MVPFTDPDMVVKIYRRVPDGYKPGYGKIQFHGLSILEMP
jgi:hypothetical protein